MIKAREKEKEKKKTTNLRTMGETILEPDSQSHYFVESPHSPWEVTSNNNSQYYGTFCEVTSNNNSQYYGTFWEVTSNNNSQYYGTFCVSSTVLPVRDHFCPHFTGEETEARQRDALPLWCSVFPHHIHVQSLI